MLEKSREILEEIKKEVKSISNLANNNLNIEIDRSSGWRLSDYDILSNIKSKLELCNNILDRITNLESEFETHFKDSMEIEVVLQRHKNYENKKKVNNICKVIKFLVYN